MRFYFSVASDIIYRHFADSRYINWPCWGCCLTRAGRGSFFIMGRSLQGVLLGSGICITCVFLLQGALLYDLTTKAKDTNDTGNALSTINRADLETPSALNPLFSIEPLKKSLHPRYKLWTEMDKQEQDESIKFVGKYMIKYGNIIAPKDVPLRKLNSVTHGNCTYAEEFVKDGHKICGPITPPCNFISFGINDDPSFDIILGNRGCRGFAGDPTVHHPSKLHENVTFHNIAATMLQDNEERVINKGGNVEW